MPGRYRVDELTKLWNKQISRGCLPSFSIGETRKTVPSLKQSEDRSYRSREEPGEEMRDSGGGKENGQETKLRGKEQEALPAQEDQRKPEAPPGLEGHQDPAEPTGPEVPQGPEEVEYEQQRMEEEEERDRAPREERAPEQGTDRGLARRTKTSSTQPAGAGGSPSVGGNSTSNTANQRTGSLVHLVPPVRQIPPPRGAPRGEDEAFHRGLRPTPS